MKNIIIGTAGHIDHGKTTLIKALTGNDTDRWEEEKKRGITIDLGFTYFDLPNKDRVGIIDVPGHEKFIKNMLAGVVGMDLVLLVIASDEGIMPQTIEHVNILNQLGVKKGIIVLTKYDLADEEWLELVKDDIREELKESFLNGAPMIEVSSTTGYGLDKLVKCIMELTEHDVECRDINTIYRLPIDRSFTISGFGTVITGTLISGRITKGNEVEIYPINKVCKVRNIQVHGTDTNECYAGQRVAINLSNIKKSEIYRGCVIAPVNSMQDTMMIDVKLYNLKSSRRVIDNRSRLHLYTGTSEVLCRAVLLDRDSLLPGESCYAQLRLEENIAVKRGDKFIVRFYSPMETIGGGEIIEPVSVKAKRFDDDIIDSFKSKENGNDIDIIEGLIKKYSQSILSVTELVKIAAITIEELNRDVVKLNESEIISMFKLKNDVHIWHKDYEREIFKQISDYLDTYHKIHKYKAGLKKSEIKSKFFPKIKQSLFDEITDKMIENQIVDLNGEYICTKGFEIAHDKKYNEIFESIYTEINSASYDLVKVTDLLDTNTEDDFIDIITNLISDGKIVRIGEELITSVEILQSAREKLVNYLSNNKSITAGEYRDVLGTNRKSSIALLEYFDSIKLTTRQGNDRILNPK